VPELGVGKVNDHKPDTDQVEKIDVIGNFPVPETGKLHQAPGECQQQHGNEQQPVGIIALAVFCRIHQPVNYQDAQSGEQHQGGQVPRDFKNIARVKRVLPDDYGKNGIGCHQKKQDKTVKNKEMGGFPGFLFFASGKIGMRHQLTENLLQASHETLYGF